MTFPHPDNVPKPHEMTWSCSHCGAHGAIPAQPQRLFRQLITQVENAHAERAAWCPYRREHFTYTVAA
jgi:hypothetical protein